MGRKDARVVVDPESDGTVEVFAERTRHWVRPTSIY
jgi:hypothetical protein